MAYSEIKPVDYSKFIDSPMNNFISKIGSDMIADAVAKQKLEYLESREAAKYKQGRKDKLEDDTLAFNRDVYKKLIGNKEKVSDKMIELHMENARTPCTKGDAACESMRVQSLEWLEQNGFLKSGFGNPKSKDKSEPFKVFGATPSEHGKALGMVADDMGMVPNPNNKTPPMQRQSKVGTREDSVFDSDEPVAPMQRQTRRGTRIQ